jgi:hypothetical protein
VYLSGTGGGSSYYDDFFLLTAGRLTGTVIPEPSKALLFALGLGALLGFSARRNS